MSKTKRIWLILGLTLMLICSGVVIAFSGSDRFSPDNLPDDMSLSDAIKLYPEIIDIYGFTMIDEKDALLRIQDGEPVLNGNEYSAKQLLSELNFKKIRED